MNKSLSTLGLCRRAGKLIIGYDAVADAIKSNTAGGVVLAADISPKTEKEVLFLAGRHEAKTVKMSFTMDEAEKILGKRAGVFFVADEGLYGSAAKHIKI